MNCKSCDYEYTYENQGFIVCPVCGHEEPIKNDDLDTNSSENLYLDANNNVLSEGDDVVVVKDLKVKGSSSVLKQGTKIKNIRLVDATDGHNIDCKIPGFGNMALKSEFLKKL